MKSKITNNIQKIIAGLLLIALYIFIIQQGLLIIITIP
jgi:hypothetical protein